MIGKKIGSYKLVGELGAGGMGRVYEAQHTLLGHNVAIKVLLDHYSNNEMVVERFFREAKAAARIRHPGLVEILDFGYTDEGPAYIVMELLKGEGLRQRIERFGRLHEKETLHLSQQLANVLITTHAAHIVHRDLKPDNIFLIPDAESHSGIRVKLLDFGVAKLTDLPEDASKTTTGTILGSPLYMSPEQCSGSGAVDHRADIYSLGCVMYHMLCGRPPFVARGSGQLIAQHIYEPPVPLTRFEPSVRSEVENLVMQCLVKDPDRRFASMAEVEQALLAVGALTAPSRLGTAPTEPWTGRAQSEVPPTPHNSAALFAPMTGAGQGMELLPPDTLHSHSDLASPTPFGSL
ncbi:MAG: serine/threonine-protein kinase, partial [Myxococcota bacterium]